MIIEIMGTFPDYLEDMPEDLLSNDIYIGGGK